MTARIIVAIVLVLVFLIPFYWMALTAIKSQGETLKFPPTFWVKNPQWQNFKNAMTSLPFAKYVLNSIIVAVSILAIQCLTVIPAAYAFARYSFKRKEILFGITLATMMIPAQLVFLPVFLLLSKLGLINTYLSLSHPSVGHQCLRHFHAEANVQASARGTS